MKQIIILFTLGLIAVLLSGCDMSQANSGQTQSWIDAPLNNSSLPLAPVKIISHSSDQAGITQVELSVNGSVIRTDSNQDMSQTLVVMSQDWVPSAPGTYTLQVRAQNTAGRWSDYAAINVTVQAQPTDTPTPVVSPTLVATLPPSLTPTLISPTFTLNENAFCRKGPDTSFPDVTAIPKGNTVDIQGVSQDGFWYFVFWKQFDAKCWVAAPAGQANGALQGIPVLVSQDTPTPLPVAEPTGYKP
jgi:outer membrane lipopolysaccharide assembly protein LptE/RlpB